MGRHEQLHHTLLQKLLHILKNCLSLIVLFSVTTVQVFLNLVLNSCLWLQKMRVNVLLLRLGSFGGLKVLKYFWVQTEKIVVWFLHILSFCLKLWKDFFYCTILNRENIFLSFYINCFMLIYLHLLQLISLSIFLNFKWNHDSHVGIYFYTGEIFFKGSHYTKELLNCLNTLIKNSYILKFLGNWGSVGLYRSDWEEIPLLMSGI